MISWLLQRNFDHVQIAKIKEWNIQLTSSEMDSNTNGQPHIEYLLVSIYNKINYMFHAAHNKRPLVML